MPTNSPSETFDNMREIVRREMMIQGLYAQSEVTDRAAAETGAICGGHKYCAIGTMIVSHGINAFSRDNEGYRTDEFNDVLVDYQTGHLEGELAKISNALDQATLDWADEHGGRDVYPALYGTAFRSRFEALFEDYDPGREALLDVIDIAEAICG